ncbi:MAG: helix-turn-helix domain-containing protein [Balneola sp.]
MTLGKFISQKRRLLGLSQEQLSDLSGISIRTIQRIENEKVNPHPYTLKKIVDQLNIDHQELNNLNNDPESNSKEHTKHLINLSPLAVLFIPLSNIVFPLILWKKNKSLNGINELGKQIVSFQVLWTVCTVILIFLAPILSRAITGSASNGQFPLIGLIYLVAILINVILSLTNTVLVNQNRDGILSKIPSLV